MTDNRATLQTPAAGGPRSFDRVASRYDAMRGGEERGMASARGISPHLTDGVVLEVGVGTGIVALGLQRLGHQVLGVDISEAMLEQARQRLPGRVQRADARNLPFPDACVANVVFVHTLHLIGDMDAGIAEAARVLRGGGRLVAVHGMPTADPDPMVDALARLSVLQPPRPDTAANLARAGAAAGLEPVTHTSGGEYDQPTTPAALIRSIEDRVPPYLWDVDDPTWSRVVEPVLAELRALPEQDAARVHRWRSECTVLAKPAG
jgi:SAM-dependent methyltransferase